LKTFLLLSKLFRRRYLGFEGGTPIRQKFNTSVQKSIVKKKNIMSRLDIYDNIQNYRIKSRKHVSNTTDLLLTAYGGMWKVPMDEQLTCIRSTPDFSHKDSD